MTKIFAHRGASGYAPENTLIAFEKAIEMHADGIELDVQLSSDGIVMVFHDETLDRTTDHKGLLKDFTCSQLKQINANNHMDEYGFVPIATLEEVLQLIYLQNIVLNIEFKTSIFTYPTIIDKTLELVEKYQMQDKVIYSSFNHLTIVQLLKKSPSSYCGLLDSDWIIDYGSYGKKLNVKALHPTKVFLNSDYMLYDMKNSGLDINVWTINTEEEMRQCFNMDITSIFTNYPDIALKQRNEYKLGNTK